MEADRIVDFHPYVIDRETISRITNAANERNIYAHPNALARGIFWQRLECLYRYVVKFCGHEESVLDLGGGSGAFLPALAGWFRAVEVVDLEIEDARSICRHYGLRNVTLREEEIGTAVAGEERENVIAADVLEHFPDLEVPVRYIARRLVPGGRLFVSLPTENLLYELGRLVVRKSKPADHYHSARTVIGFFEARGFSREAECFVPRRLGLSLPLFRVAVLRRGG